jgi:hypothetical protein
MGFGVTANCKSQPRLRTEKAHLVFGMNSRLRAKPAMTPLKARNGAV